MRKVQTYESATYCFHQKLKKLGCHDSFLEQRPHKHHMCEFVACSHYLLPIFFSVSIKQRQNTLKRQKHLKPTAQTKPCTQEKNVTYRTEKFCRANTHIATLLLKLSSISVCPSIHPFIYLLVSKIITSM